jgi:hypothetical protein
VATERPPPSSADPDDPERERQDPERERRRLERILPEILKRIIETGYEKLSEGPGNVRHFVSELKLPKEALTVLLAQMDETKNGLYRTVAKEVRDFLDHTNFAEELAKVLTTLSFEIKTEVRFIPNDARQGGTGKGAVPDVRSKVSLKRDRRTPVPEQTVGPPQSGSSQPPEAEANAEPHEDMKP